MKRAFQAALHKSGTRVRFGVPSVHAAQNLGRLTNGHHWALVKDVELSVRDDRCHFKHAIDFRLQAGHFHVNPNEVVVRIGGIALDAAGHKTVSARVVWRREF